MPDSALAKKLKIRPGQRAAVVNPPDGYLKELGALPSGVKIAQRLPEKEVKEGSLDWVQIFVRDSAELNRLAPKAIRALAPESLLWVSFPKGASRIQTDLTRDKGWDVLQQADLKWVNLISVNQTWSAFALRPYKPGEKRQSFR